MIAGRIRGRVTMVTLASFLACIVPVAAPAQASTAPSLVAQAAAATIAGTVTDVEGAPIAGAAIALRGPANYTATTDAKGVFSVSDVKPGVYAMTVTKAGFDSAIQSDVVAIAGESQQYTVRMGRATFSSLRTIATVTSRGRGTLNTSPASVSVVSTQAFIDQAAPQVTRVLSQVPGLQISFPSNSSNAASPGSITIPNIRGATSYETASLIDGHPISVGQYGDNVTTFLNSFMFGSVEVIKGPGADSPVVNNAIGGTTNFRTKDPTATPMAQILYGVDNRGGTMSNFEYSNTVGKLGFVLDFATDNNPSALSGKQVWYDPSNGTVSGAGSSLQGNASSTQIGNTASYLTTQYPLLACCYTLYGNLDQTAELAKARYQFSPATSATISFLGGQSYSDQNGNTSDFINGQFVPTDPTYSGSLKPGNLQVANVFPGAYSGEHNNEPIFQGEISTTLGKDTILARYYHASILRYQFQGGTNPNNLDYNLVNLYGTSSNTFGNTPVNQTFNGGQYVVGYNDFYQEPELDKLGGVTFEYQHPIANDGLVTFSVDRTKAQSVDYSVFSGPFYSFNLPPGTNQTLTTYLLRGHFFFGPRLAVTFSNYLNTYSSTYPVGCPPDPNNPGSTNCNTYAAAVNGTGVIFGTTNNAHYDPRIAFVYRPNNSASIRFSAGSAIAPPFLGLLNQIASTPTYTKSTGVALESASNGNLKPETAWGYDLGADARLKDPSTIVSGDVYFTNLFNRFFGQTLATGQTCSATVVCENGDSPGAPVPAGTAIYNQTNTNISNARFEGIELAIKRTPAYGFGFVLEGAVQKGFYYDLPPYFYCSLPGPGCKHDQNQNIISGQNTNGLPVGFYNISYNGNMRIPYSQGNAEVNWRFKNGAYVALGDTYYGFNNSLNEPAFGLGYATLRYPVSKALDLQVSGDNIFNKYPGYLPILGGGVPIPLEGGQTGATTGNVLGPATWRFVLETKLP